MAPSLDRRYRPVPVAREHAGQSIGAEQLPAGLPELLGDRFHLVPARVIKIDEVGSELLARMWHEQPSP